MTDDEYEIPNDDDVSPEDIEPGADLLGADLSDANLEGADLSRADLSGADLSGANLERADLSEAELGDTNLSGAMMNFSNLSETYMIDVVATNADMHRANFAGATMEHCIFSKTNLSSAALEGAELFETNLSWANLSGADFSGADLTDSDLSDAVLWNTSFSGALLSRNTDIGSQKKIFERVAKESDVGTFSDAAFRWDAIARANHELKTAYSDNGLIGQARDARVRERRARRKEAKAEDGWRGTVAWAGSVVSRVVTGYGVQIWPVALLMILLWFGSATVYTLYGGMVWADSLYFSVVTFTTSPPPEPALSGISRFVAGVETFLGTTAIVFLGYVLGTRERV